MQWRVKNLLSRELARLVEDLSNRMVRWSGKESGGKYRRAISRYQKFGTTALQLLPPPAIVVLEMHGPVTYDPGQGHPTYGNFLDRDSDTPSRDHTTMSNMGRGYVR